MTITRIGLVAKVTLPLALEALAEAARWIEARDLKPLIDAESAAAAGLADTYEAVPRETLAGAVDVLMAFGGDGTLLEAASLVVDAHAETPVLGINLGRLGFLTEVGRADLIGALEVVAAGQARAEPRLMIAGRVVRDGSAVAERLALNDIVITRGAFSGMIEVDVDVDGDPVCQVKADGIIIATATGSTAYNLSAGGPIVHPTVDAFVLTPIAPHTLTNRPLVLPAAAHITLRPTPGRPTDMVVTFDGSAGQRLGPDDVVEIGRAARALHLLRTTPRTHFDMLREKLKWGSA